MHARVNGRLIVDRCFFILKETVVLDSSSNKISISFLCCNLCFMWFCRFCCEKSPEAIRILLPDETSPAVSPVNKMI